MFTIGHSTLPIEIFLQALQENGIELLIDIRTVPRSRHNPQYGTEALGASLRVAGIDYRWIRELGGLRRSAKDSINTGWRNSSFRGYADYMQTPQFATALENLKEIDGRLTAAVMCAEAVPWRCHRSLIADALLVRGCSVQDLFVSPTGRSTGKSHTLTPFARIDGVRLWYPDPQELPWPEENTSRNG